MDCHKELEPPGAVSDIHLTKEEKWWEGFKEIVVKDVL